MNVLYRILYVDDDPNLLEIGQFFLEESGDFAVVTSNLATEALNLPGLASFDAIISDYEMPQMDGIAFLKIVRKVHGDIPFILFTGKGREEVVIEAINNGADFYLQKGGDPEAQFAELAHKTKKAVERKRADSALQESEARLSLTMEVGNAGMWEWNTDTNKVRFDSRFHAMLGYAPGELPTTIQEWLSYHNPEDVPVWMAKAEAYLRGESPLFESEHRIRNRSGEWNWVFTRGRFATPPLPGVQRLFIGFAMNITERKRLEADLGKKHEELKVSYAELDGTKRELHRQFNQLLVSERTLRVNEERLVMAQRIGQTGSWEYDIATDKIWGSAEGLYIFGYPPVAGDFPLNAIEACIPERERVHQALVDMITKGQEYNLEYVINPADGSASKIIHSIARLEKDADGNPLRIIGVIHDITGRKKTEEELCESEHKFATVFQSNPVALTLVSATDGVFVEVNNAFLIHTGYAREEIIGKTSEELGIFTDNDEYAQMVSHLKNQGYLRGMELRCRIKTGEIRTCRFSSSIIRMGGKPYILSTVEDITERKQAEEENWKARQILEGILNSIHVRVFWKDRNLMYLGCNTPFARDAGFEKPEDIIGRDDFAMGWRDQADLYRSDDRSVIASGMPKIFIEEPQKTPSGNIITLLTSKVPLRDAEGNIIGVLGTYIDITERKKAEGAHKKS
jgi:PAS domain S-box-containing protein